MACLLATVIGMRVLGILRVVDGALWTSMRNREEVGPSFGGVVVSRVANASAVRAGRKSWDAHVSCNTVWRSCRHVSAFDWDIPKSWPCPSWLGCCVKEVKLRRRWSALVGKGHVSYGRSRRLVRGGPSMGRSRREASNAASTRGRSAVLACAVHPVIARQLPARWVTVASLGLDTSDTRGLVVRPDILSILRRSIVGESYASHPMFP